MTWHEDQIQPAPAPILLAKDKPVLLDAQGREIQITRLVGFGSHPAVPKTKIKGTR